MSQIDITCGTFASDSWRSREPVIIQPIIPHLHKDCIVEEVARYLQVRQWALLLSLLDIGTIRYQKYYILAELIFRLIKADRIFNREIGRKVLKILPVVSMLISSIVDDISKLRTRPPMNLSVRK